MTSMSMSMLVGNFFATGNGAESLWWDGGVNR